MDCGRYGPHGSVAFRVGSGACRVTTDTAPRPSYSASAHQSERSKAAPVARRKKKGANNEAPEWSKYRREGETWKPPPPPLLRRKASSNIKCKQRRAFKRKIIKRLHKNHKKCLALPPAPQCYASTPEEEAPLEMQPNHGGHSVHSPYRTSPSRHCTR